VAAIALTLVAACGSEAGRTASPTTPSRASGSQAGGRPSAGTTTSGASTGTTSRSGSAASSGAATSAPLGRSSGGRVTLAKTCIRRGDPSDQQSLTVTAGPGETVTYSTYYSDYSTELSRPDYTTGYGYGQAGADGRYRATWIVPARATTGRATVRVTAGDIDQDAQEASFVVVKQGERCP
jgi:hypothetical protein